MVMSGVIVSAVLVMHRTRSVRVAKDDGEPTVQRREHEARGNERTQAKHCQHERRRPMAPPSMPQPVFASRYHRAKMP
jgi:hypothetical protein